MSLKIFTSAPSLSEVEPISQFHEINESISVKNGLFFLATMNKYTEPTGDNFHIRFASLSLYKCFGSAHFTSETSHIHEGVTFEQLAFIRNIEKEWGRDADEDFLQRPFVIKITSPEMLTPREDKLTSPSALYIPDFLLGFNHSPFLEAFTEQLDSQYISPSDIENSLSIIQAFMNSPPTP